MTGLEDKALNTVDKGFDTLFASENIAIVALSVMCLILVIFVALQYWRDWKKDEIHRSQIKECWDAQKESATVTQGLKEAITILNERLRS